MSIDMSKTTVKEIENRILNHEDNLEDVHGIQHKTAEYNTGLKETSVEKWEKPPHRARVEPLSTDVVREFTSDLSIATDLTQGRLENGGELIVRNGSSISKYDSEQNLYDIVEFDSPDDIAGSVSLPTLIRELLGETYKTTLEEPDRLLDRQTSVLSFEPTENADLFSQRLSHSQMWVDQTYYYPLKIEMEYQATDGIFTTTKVFEDIEFNTGLEDELFDFEPPKNAKKVE